MRKRAELSILLRLVFVAATLMVSSCSLSRFESGDLASEHDLWIREEIIFGTDIPGGGNVSDDVWQQFLSEVVTPRFPDGFTTLQALGQYRMQNGEIIREKSWILILYLPGHTLETNKAVNEIIELYKQQFKQESVLRSTSPARVRFQ